jgi:hypothetical protein
VQTQQQSWVGASRPPKRAFERLEGAAGKLARRVLRGGGDSNAASLPDNIIRKGQIEGIGKGDIRGQVRFVSNLFMIAA